LVFVYTQKFPRLAFVDLETTGGVASEDRITEVGIIEVDENGVREWSSLVNPQRHIPEFIQSLTGISDDMVKDAPTFAELADDIAARLADRVFIAHNARFDFGFLRSEFRRTGHDFNPPVLCTVRLSRKLFPGFARHNLDSVADRHCLQVTERHRALGDAQLIWQFWQKIHKTHSAETIEETVTRLLGQPGLPAKVDALRIEEMPSTHGVYLFYGDNGLPLYVGQAGNLRHRVLAHFSASHASVREQCICRETTRIEWIETGGELGASLQEASLVKKLMPAYNRPMRGNDELCAWRLLQHKSTLKPVLAFADDLFFGYDPDLYGLYGNRHKACDALKAIADAHGLCHGLLGLEKLRVGKPCSARQSGTCVGACIGEESIESHNTRLHAALQGVHLQPWPFPGPIGIREGEALHVVDCWAYLGMARSEQETAALLQEGSRRFDRDVYQILQKRLPKLDEHIVPL
jgi:DNA polymerase-3 subunit epsilon